MPTSSLFTNFTITDKKAAEQFLDALDEAYERPAWEPTCPNPLCTDPDVIRKLVANYEDRNDG